MGKNLANVLLVLSLISYPKIKTTFSDSSSYKIEKITRGYSS